MKQKSDDTKAWYYAYGGYHGEPDFSGPAKLTNEQANGRWSANYDIAGPFDSRKVADEHLAAWLDSVEG